MIRRRGFTLIEIMLVSVIFATISVAIFTCLSNGIKLWERSKQLAVEEDAAIFLDRFAADIRNSFSYSKIPFSGGELHLEFPTIVWTPADRVSVRADEGLVDQIGRVKYAYDPARALIVRAQANYSQALLSKWGDEQIVVPVVKDLRFHYFYGASKDPHVSAGPDDGIPSGVEVYLTVPGSGGVGEKIFKRYVSIPSGV
ncbi:MAG: prepilin-type N-terminal cleavage/methylation domain-containing protein [Candidatus Omnitrophica bacterium]|nr:prepilin-type N-terminal cleavage/methylation domain-containing protein [Candidatus Omnitrophota bacterium]